MSVEVKWQMPNVRKSNKNHGFLQILVARGFVRRKAKERMGLNHEAETSFAWMVNGVSPGTSF